jgi:hypothetical protein
MGKERMMTAVTFAEEMNVDYATVIRWLKLGIVPGADLQEPVPGMKVWQIPESALQMKRPLAGRKRGEKKAAAKKPAKAGAKKSGSGK